MTRLRYNGLRTTLGGALSNSATSITFAAALTHSGGTAVPTISGGDYIPLALLDPTTGQLEEIVHLTAYTSGATTGTISRGQASTTGVSHSVGDLVINAPMVADIPDTSGFQPVDSDLTAIAALTTTTYGRAFLELANQAALVALLPSYQPLDSDLTSIAALSTTSYGRALLELANQAALMALVAAASETVPGKIEIATDAEVTAATDDARAVTPLKLSNQFGAFYSFLGGVFQPLDGDLTSIAALTTTTYGRAFLTLANQAALVALLPSYQPLDSDLTSLAALSTTSYGRALLELANQAGLMALLSSASDTVQGKVELATNAETATGTDATRAVTPAGLASLGLVNTPDASDTVKGKVELATFAETVAGTDTVRAVTPANFKDGLDRRGASMYLGHYEYLELDSTPTAGQMAWSSDWAGFALHTTDADSASWATRLAEIDQNWLIYVTGYLGGVQVANPTVAPYSVGTNVLFVESADTVVGSVNPDSIITPGSMVHLFAIPKS